MTNGLTSSKAAFRLTHVLNAVAGAHGTQRFPVDVVSVARESARIFGWPDPITEVQAADIKNFEGALYAGDERKCWLILYNHRLRSPGRIRFTQAHELGHYLLHRAHRNSFECSESDMVDLTQDSLTIEAQADDFSSALLMPLDDFRAQMNGTSDFDALGACAERYGTSLTATTLRWLKHTDANAVLVVHRDGFLLWSYASNSAYRNGAFFKTRSNIIAIPQASIASDTSVETERIGIEIAARTWFPHAPKELSIKEMKICADQFDYVMTLLVLPRFSSVWKPREEFENSVPAVNRF